MIATISIIISSSSSSSSSSNVIVISIISSSISSSSSRCIIVSSSSSSSSIISVIISMSSIVCMINCGFVVVFIAPCLHHSPGGMLARTLLLNAKIQGFGGFQSKPNV